MLPAEVRVALEKKIIDNAFGNYAALTEWLNEQGYEICRSAVSSYGKRFQDRVEAMRLAMHQAREMKAHFPDEDATMSEMILQMGEASMFDLMMAGERELSTKEISVVMRSASEVVRAKLAVQERQDKLRREAAAVAQEAQEIGKRGGLSEEACQQIMEKILGIAA